MELVIDRRIVWNSRSLKQIDEAKKIIMAFKKAGHIILKVDGTIMEKFNPGLEEVLIKVEKTFKKVLKILTEFGDDRIVWDKDNGPQTKEAKKKFVELLEKDYTAYSVDTKGKKNRKIEEFDVDAEEIIMIPKTIRG